MVFALLLLTSECVDDVLAWDPPPAGTVAGYILRAEWIAAQRNRWQITLPPDTTSVPFGCSAHPTYVCISSLSVSGQESEPTCLIWNRSAVRSMEWTTPACYVGPDLTRRDACPTLGRLYPNLAELQPLSTRASGVVPAEAGADGPLAAGPGLGVSEARAGARRARP
jgi:hypothetical protein